MSKTTYIVTNKAELNGDDAFVQFAADFYTEIEGYAPIEPFTADVAMFYIQNFGGDTQLLVVNNDTVTITQANERDAINTLLSECLVALNRMPNTQLDASGFCSFDLASRIETTFNQFKL